MTLHHTPLHYITLHYITLQYSTELALHHITYHYNTLHYRTLQYTTYHYITHLHSYTHTYIPTCIHRDMHTHIYIACRKGWFKRYRQTDRNTCMDGHGCMQALCHACTYTQGRIHRHTYIEHACQHGNPGLVWNRGRHEWDGFFPHVW